MKEDEINTEYDYHKYWKEMYEKERKLRQEVEGENTIIKGIGQNSPEMKALQQKNYELKKEICELRQDNRKLSKQIEDRIDQLRKAGM
jgi:predicted transcriptional regulator